MKHSPRLLFLILFGIPLISSAQIFGATRKVPFNEAEFAAYAAPGSASVSGHLVVTDPQGGVHSGNQCIVALLPVTAYTKEAVQRQVLNAEHLAHPDRRFTKYRLATKCNKAGDFSFKGVPAGEYFLVSLVEWNELFDNPDYQWAMAQIKVSKGQAYTTTLSHNPQRPDQSLMVVFADDL